MSDLRNALGLSKAASTASQDTTYSSDVSRFIRDKGASNRKEAIDAIKSFSSNLEGLEENENYKRFMSSVNQLEGSLRRGTYRADAMAEEIVRLSKEPARIAKRDNRILLGTGIGAAGGAGLGALLVKNNRILGALAGMGVGGLSGAGLGYLYDNIAKEASSSDLIKGATASNESDDWEKAFDERREHVRQQNFLESLLVQKYRKDTVDRLMDIAKHKKALDKKYPLSPVASIIGGTGGALVGAGLGHFIGDSNNKWLATGIGGATGAALGGLTGSVVDLAYKGLQRKLDANEGNEFINKYPMLSELVDLTPNKTIKGFDKAVSDMSIEDLAYLNGEEDIVFGKTASAQSPREAVKANVARRLMSKTASATEYTQEDLNRMGVALSQAEKLQDLPIIGGAVGAVGGFVAGASAKSIMPDYISDSSGSLPISALGGGLIGAGVGAGAGYIAKALYNKYRSADTKRKALEASKFIADNPELVAAYREHMDAVVGGVRSRVHY